MFSTPLICSSIGVATVCAISRGLAPGNTARTTTVGGTTSGYSLTGRKIIAIPPVRKMTIDRTAASTGRSTKNFERCIKNGRLVDQPRVLAGCTIRSRFSGRGRARRVHRDFLRGHRHARAHALQAVDDDAIAGLEPG